MATDCQLGLVCYENACTGNLAGLVNIEAVDAGYDAPAQVAATDASMPPPAEAGPAQPQPESAPPAETGTSSPPIPDASEPPVEASNPPPTPEASTPHEASTPPPPQPEASTTPDEAAAPPQDAGSGGQGD